MKKYLKPAIALCLVAALAIGGTLAYLTDSTEEITNTFTPDDDIDIYLTETDQDYTLVPGNVTSKDPTVNVTVDSSSAYIFVDVTETITTTALTYDGDDDQTDPDYTFNSYVDYSVMNTWRLINTGTAVVSENDGTTSVTYTYVYVGTATSGFGTTVTTDSDDEMDLQILDGSDTNADGEVTTPTDVTQAMIALLEVSDTVVSPTLTFQAYAIQSDNVTAPTTAATAYDIYELITETAEYETSTTDGAKD